MNWINIYKKVLENVCEKPQTPNGNIVEVDFFEIENDLIFNEKSKENSLFRMKLTAPLKQDKCKKFCELIYSYIGLDIYDYLPNKRFNKFKK